jgi:hypothetical protein
MEGNRNFEDVPDLKRRNSLSVERSERLGALRVRGSVCTSAEFGALDDSRAVDEGCVW